MNILLFIFMNILLFIFMNIFLFIYEIFQIQSTNQATDELDGNLSKGFKYTVNAADPETISDSSGSETNQMPGQHKPIEYGKYTVINDDHQHFSKNHLSVNEKLPKKESSRFSWSGYKKAFKVTDKRRHSIHEDNNSGFN